MTKSSKILKFPKTDKRLLGTWKSGRARTFKEWRWTKRLSPNKKKWLQSLFGKVELTFTRTRVVSTLRHRKWEQSRRYALVAADETSVAIVYFGKVKIKNRREYDLVNLKIVDDLFPARPSIQHVHFDKSHFWISLGNGKNREFFRKLARRK